MALRIPDRVFYFVFSIDAIVYPELELLSAS